MSGDIDYPQGCLPIENTTNTSQQIERLRKLAGCLYDCRPNNSDEVKSPNRFAKLFYHLSRDCFLDNSNSDFRIYHSLCLANILRVFQPEIPTPNVLDLKDVYLYLFRTLRGLGDIKTDSPMFKHYFHLVEAIEKIIHPLSEMNNFDDKEATPVIRALVKEILTIPCGKGWRGNAREEMRIIKKQMRIDKEESGKEEDEEEEEENSEEKIKNSLIALATSTISELDYVPNEVLDVLFYHIISPQRTNFPKARRLAEEILHSCLESGNNPLATSIRNSMIAASKEGKLPDEFELTGSNNRSKFFEVFRYLHHVSNEFVSSAIQELNFWLQSENELYRKEAVHLVGELTNERHCQFGMDSDDSTWTSFLNAAIDPEDSVRLEYANQSKVILLSNHSHLRGQVINSLLRLSKDTNDDIRSQVVIVVTEVAKCKLEVISDKLLKACADRMKDKKGNVRTVAIKRLMDLYHHVMTSSPKCAQPGNTDEAQLPYTESDKECVRFIPTTVFHVYRLTQRIPAYHDARFLIERYFQLNFVPYTSDAKNRVHLMADLYRNLDDFGSIMFVDIVNRSSQLRRAFITILSQIGSSTEMTSESSALLKERIRRISHMFPEPAALEKQIMSFVNQMAENEQIFNLVKQLMADSYTTEENVSAATSLKHITGKKINVKGFPIFRQFIDRISPLSIDTLAAKELVCLVSTTVSDKLNLKKYAENCFEKDLSLLKVFTDHFAHLFADEQIVEQIRSKILTSEEPRAVEAALNALSKVLANSIFRHKLEEDETRREKWYLSIIRDLKDLVMREDSELRRSSKLATRLFASLVGKEKSVEFFDSQIDELLDRLNIDNEGAANAFQVLSELFRTDMAHYFDRIMEVVESDKIGPLILTSSQVSPDDPIEFNDLVHMEKQAWTKFSAAKIYAAKFATKVLTTYNLMKDPENKKRMETAAQKLIDILSEIIEKKGDLGGKQCDLEKARLRAVASACLLKLATIIPFRSKIHTGIFKNMAFMITDEAYCVRLYYAFHVKKGLSKKLPVEFSACYGLVNLGLTEEEGENKMEGFKAICQNHVHQVFAERSDDKANLLKLEGCQRVVFCAETVIAYVVWLLANYDKLEKIEPNAENDDPEEVLEEKVANVNLLAELQESLWLIIDSLKVAKCNMQKVWRVLEKLKTCGDKSTRHGFTAKQVKERNKKLWALCDLGITMMLYRAKLQMEDQEAKDTGFNLQFFYVCSAKDGADPSNVYAPDVLINDEKHRNGRLPKPGRVFQVSDLISGSAPAVGNDSSTSSMTSTKNVSKRGDTTTTRKRGTAKTTRGKRRSGGSKVSDVSDNESLETKTKSPIVRRSRSKRGAYDPPVDEEEEDQIEVMPVSKRRRAPAVSSTASSSTSVNGNSTRNGVSSLKKRNSRAIRNQEFEIEVESEPDKDGEEEDVSLDNLVISPILNESSGRTRRSARTATLTSSTPLVASKPKITKRKRSQVTEPVTIEEEEKIEESPSPKKRTSGRRVPPLPAKKTASPSKKPPVKSPVKSPVKANGTSPNKNKFGLPLEEEEQLQSPSTSSTVVRTRTTRRLRK